jgi:hypothetical protein
MLPYDRPEDGRENRSRFVSSIEDPNTDSTVASSEKILMRQITWFRSGMMNAAGQLSDSISLVKAMD